MKVQYWLLSIHVRVPYCFPQARAGILCLGLKEPRILVTRLLCFPLACTFGRWLGGWVPVFPVFFAGSSSAWEVWSSIKASPFWLDGVLPAPGPLRLGSSSSSSSLPPPFWLLRQLPLPSELFPSPLFPPSPPFPPSPLEEGLSSPFPPPCLPGEGCPRSSF